MLYAVAAGCVLAMDSDSGSAGLECVADDGQSITPGCLGLFSGKSLQQPFLLDQLQVCVKDG